MEILSLLELSGEEATLKDPRSQRRNADIYGLLDEALAERGHHPRTLDQVRSKVKELCQGYARARECSSRSGAGPNLCPYYEELHRILRGGEALSPPITVDSGLETPVVAQPELLDDDEEEDKQQLQKEEDMASTVTLTLEPVPQALDISQASSDTGEGSSAGPAFAEGRSTPSEAAARPRGSRKDRRVHEDLMREHMAILRDMQ